MRSRFGRTVLVILALVGWAKAGPHAQAPVFQTVSPFDVVGFIDAATLTPADDGFSGGGTITVNGTVITVPANTLLQMPAFALTWQEVFMQAPAPYGIGSGPNGEHQSGLARTDAPAPYTTFEVRVQGNRVGNQYIAGLMFVAQQSLNSGAGFINFIDYATGELRVGGAIGDAKSGARVVINDPAGKFGRVRTNDARFTIDEDNPTVRSETAYPMCIPRIPPTDPQIDPATGTQAFKYVDPKSGREVLPFVDDRGVPKFSYFSGSGNRIVVDGPKQVFLFGDALCPEANRPKGVDGN